MSLSPLMSWLLVLAVIAVAVFVASLLLGDQALLGYWRQGRRPVARVEGRTRDELLELLDDPDLSLDDRARMRRRLQELDEVARRFERAYRGQSA